MSEYRRETEFLRRCILYDASAGRRELQAEIIRIERARRCVHRAAWLMAVLTALALAFISYPAIMLTNFPYSAPRFIVNLVCALGMGSLISLLIYLAMGMVYRRRLDQRRRECCQMVTRLLEDRLGKPFVTPVRLSQENSVGQSDNGASQIAVQTDDSPLMI